MVYNFEILEAPAYTLPYARRLFAQLVFVSHDEKCRRRGGPFTFFLLRALVE